MNYKKEQTILKIIKFTPPIFIITMSIFLIIFLYFEYKTTYLQEKQLMEKEFIEYNKKIIKSNVDTVYNTILEMQKNTELELKKSIKERVYEAKKIATKIYNENKHKDKNIIKKMIKDALVDIRFNDGRGYYYIYSMDYECILFPLNRSIEGKNFYNFKDGKGKYLTRDIIAQLKQNNEGFMSWDFYKPSDMTKSYRKIGFNVYFEPLDWFIGTGEYLDEFENGIKLRALTYIKTLKYINDNYIFVLDYDGTYLYHKRKEIIGTNGIKSDSSKYDVKDSVNVVSQAINIAKNEGEGYLSYTQYNKPNTEKSTKKISFVKGIQNWNWFIGQGFYEDDFEVALEEKRVLLEQKFKSYITNVFMISILLMIILLFASKYVSIILEKKFGEYKKEIEDFVKENNHQRDILAHQSKMSAMGEMIGNIAHQWRQPLSVITTAASGVKLNKELGVLDDKNLEESMDIVVEQSLYLSHIIEDFKDFLKEKKEKTCFKVERVVDKAINLAYGKFENSGITIIKNIDDIEFHSAENQFVQVLINILKNSSDEFEKINDKEKIIIINSTIKDNFISLSIQDNAGGIPNDIISRIFEPYFTTKHQYQGTGMGLYMTEEIISKGMNGEISVSNEEFENEGKKYFGAKFEIILPIDS
ncbi:sensor histidine kinase [Arcobacter sp.]|uniref:sensor histidine kinase n=1 Tax=Arcobacter sp. TaxID=1872629 RepID=UPI003D12CEBF